jgi:hypothetical protein
VTKALWLLRQLRDAEDRRDWFLFSATLRLLQAMGAKVLRLDGGYIASDPKDPR